MDDPFLPRGNFSNRCSASIPVIKMRLENEIVRKREADTRRTETWRSNDKYFHHWSTQNEKFDHWASPRSALNSQRGIFKRETEMEVSARREALKKLYTNDKMKEKQQLVAIEKKTEEEKWEKMKDKVQSYRQYHSVKTKKLAEVIEHEQWKMTSSSYKAFESELKKQQQLEVWAKQKEMKEQEKLRNAEEVQRERWALEQEEKNDKLREEKERILVMERKSKYREELDRQMAQLRIKDKEAEEQKREYQKLIAETHALQEVQDRIRNREEEILKKKLIGEFLTKQHLAKLRQRSKEISQDLENEKSFAEQLFSCKISTKTKEELRKEMLQYLQLLEKHREMEKERQKETDFLFQEEAKKVWEAREKEWEAERLARKRLIEDVVAAQKDQIETRIMQTKNQRMKLIRDREEIVESMENYNRILKSKEVDDKLRQMQTKEDLLAQIEMKKQMKEDADFEEQQRTLREQLRQSEYDERHWAIEMDRLQL